MSGGEDRRGKMTWARLLLSGKKNRGWRSSVWVGCIRVWGVFEWGVFGGIRITYF